MAIKNNKIAILSLGGSLIAPSGGVDAVFLKKFRSLILNLVKSGWRFVLVCGGGTTCRNYQAAAKAIAHLSAKELDWVGIYTTWFHANFIKTLFGKLAHKEIVINPNLKINWKSKILIAGGWQPGRSTDDDAVRLAKNFGASLVVNLSNIDYVYDRDPKLPGARKLTKVTWPEMAKIVGNKWSPGKNVPFDPLATRQAAKLGLKVAFISGHSLKSLNLAIKNKTFLGTLIG